ncbi:MAG TPA: MoaD/ThiS family protein [Acidimicrobiales bacterium]|nr:MoaD/ThiS family protein [Acidimicrobiales bacterium]
MTCVIRVVLPHHLRNLAGVSHEVRLAVDDDAGPATQAAVMDALETAYPPLRGTIRDPATMRRRPFIRFYAGGDDLSHDPPEAPLPDPVLAGAEPFCVVGAMAGG